MNWIKFLLIGGAGYMLYTVINSITGDDGTEDVNFNKQNLSFNENQYNIMVANIKAAIKNNFDPRQFDNIYNIIKTLKTKDDYYKLYSLFGEFDAGTLRKKGDLNFWLLNVSFDNSKKQKMSTLLGLIGIDIGFGTEKGSTTKKALDEKKELEKKRKASPKKNKK